MTKKWIRILALLLCVCILQTPVFAAETQEDEQVIEVKNPGFEELNEDEWVTSWGKMSGEAEFGVETSKVHSGNHSVHISTKKGNSPWVAQSVYGLEPGSLYELSVFINATVSGEKGAGMKMEFYSAREETKETYLPDAQVPNVYPNGEFVQNSNNRWIEHKTIFYVPQETVKAKLYLRLYGVGEAYFDDVSIKFSGGPEKYTFDTDKVFHYKEETGGYTYVKIDDYYLGRGVDDETRVDFVVYDGETVMEKAENVTFNNLEAGFTYSTSYMEPYKKYVLKCNIKNTKGEILETHEQNLYVVDRPSMLSEDGYMLIDGARFNPILGYHVSVADYPKAIEAGFNTVQLTTSGEVDWKTMADQNLKGVLCLYRNDPNGGFEEKCAGSPYNLERTKELVRKVLDNEVYSKNIIAFAIMDEPFLSGDKPILRDYMEQAYLAIREIDKTHPVYVCDKKYDYISTKYCDLYCIDSYATGGNTRGVSRETATAWQETKDKNGFWELAATYYIGNGRMATMNDARNSVYRAFEEGARGIGYYAFSDCMKDREGYGANIQMYHWEEWDAMCKFNHEEAPILFDYFVNDKATRFNDYDDGNGIDSVKWFSWFVGDDMYVAIHNRAMEEKQVTVPLRSENGKVVIAGYKAEPIGLTTQSTITGNGEISVTLKTEEIALYKVKPDQKVDLSKLKEASFDDLAGYEWAAEAIGYLDGRNIVNAVSEGKYAPGEAITRLDFVSFLVRALGLSDEGEAFPDCDAAEIKIARKAGITNGDTDGNFRPYDTITRQDIMTTAARAYSAKATDKEIQVFSDWSLVSDYALDAVRAMVQAEVIVGNGDGTLNPLGLATRAEAAVMLHRMMHTTFETGSGEAPKPAEKPSENVREEITFADAPDAASLEKWNRAAELVKGLGVGDISVEKSVTYGDLEAYLSALLGAKYDAFENDFKALTYSEAVETMVKILGYEVQAQANGGYLLMAAQLDLTKGISAGEYIRGGELAVLFENAFDIKMADRTSYGSDESYRETDEKLLSRYQNVYKFTGVVDGDWYSGADLKKGQILLDGEIFTGGEGYLGRRVELWARKADDDKEVVFIRKTASSTEFTLDKEDIIEANTSYVRYENENGKENSVSVSGATLYFNGTKKTGWTKEDLLPEMGTVTFIENYGNGADVILVEKYENRVVQSVYAADYTVYFKNGDPLVLDTESKLRFSMDFKLDAVKEWNVISVLLREDKSVYKVILSNSKVEGAPTEISSAGVLIGDKEYKVANGAMNTPALNEKAVFYLDFSGKIAALNDENLTPEYGYYTTLEFKAGLEDAVSFRIFTKEGEMKVFKAADKVTLDGAPVTAAELSTTSKLWDAGQPVGQLVVYELNADGELTALDTAEDHSYKENAKIPDVFSKVFDTSFPDLEKPLGYANQYIGYNVKTLGAKYRISDRTVTFKVPDTYSANEKDYSVSIGIDAYKHSTGYPNTDVFDWHDDYTVGAVVQKVSTGVKTVEAGSNDGLFVGISDVLDEDGMMQKALHLISTETGLENIYYIDPDMEILVNEYTMYGDKEDNIQTAKVDGTTYNFIKVSDLDFGDTVLFEVNKVDGVTITAMSLLFRAKSNPESGEIYSKEEKYFHDYFHYAPLNTAYGPVLSVFEDGIAMRPGKYERIYMKYASGSVVVPAIILDMDKETYRVATIDEIRKDDMVFVRRYNPYVSRYVVYR